MRSINLRNQLAGVDPRDFVHDDILAANRDPEADDLITPSDVEPGEVVLPASYDGELDGQWHIGNLVFSEREEVEVIDAEYNHEVGPGFVEEDGQKIPKTEKFLDKIIIEVNDEPYAVPRSRIGRCRDCGQLVQQTGVCYRCADASERGGSQ